MQHPDIDESSAEDENPRKPRIENDIDERRHHGDLVDRSDFGISHFLIRVAESLFFIIRTVERLDDSDAAYILTNDLHQVIKLALHRVKERDGAPKDKTHGKEQRDDEYNENKSKAPTQPETKEYTADKQHQRSDTHPERRPEEPMERVCVRRQPRFEGRDSEFIHLTRGELHRSREHILSDAPYRSRRCSRRHTVRGKVEYPRAERKDNHGKSP